MQETFMTALHINDVRHLKNISIPLSQTERKHLILTGKNGSGKTSVLAAVKDFLDYVVSDNFRTKNEIQSSISFCENQIIDEPQTEEEKIKNAGNIESKNFWMSKNQMWTKGATISGTSYADLRSKYRDGEYILAYYGDSREINVETSKNIEKVDLKPFYTMQDHPSRKLVKYLVNLKTTAAFAQTNNNPARAQEISDWFDRFQQTLREIYENDSLDLKFNIETFQFTIEMDGREPFDFNTMSMGYAAVFDIISDLMMRMESKRRYDLEGIVLIDEIETHLHVDLQKKIMPILTKLFPKLQFILTTHSPFILNSTPDAVIYDLENKTLVKDGLTKLPYEGIVEGYFGVSQLSDELKQKFDEYRSLAQKVNLTDADYARIEELEMYLDEIPDYLALDVTAEYSRLKLELSNRG